MKNETPNQLIESRAIYVPSVTLLVSSLLLVLAQATSIWLFLSGDMESTKATVIEGFKIALERRPNADVDPAGIIHGSHLVLVDAELKIRGYYRSEEPAALKKLLNDAKLLLAK